MNSPQDPAVPVAQSAVVPPRHLALIRQMLTFGVVGVGGFLIDAGTLYLARWVGTGLILGRLISYVTAATATWALNRRFTFSSRQTRGLLYEWALFMVSQLAGAACNIGVYVWLVTTSTLVSAQPIFGVAAGSLAGMLVNFFVAKKFVFKES